MLSMFSLEEPRVRTTASDMLPEPSEPVTEWMARVLDLPSTLPELPVDMSLSGLFGKMSPIPYRHGIPVGFCGSSPSLGTQGIFVPGALLTGAALDCPTSRGNALSWSEIVATGDVPQRYYLSQKALQGIAKRSRRPPLFSLQEGEWLSMTERHAYWMSTALV